jgi:hypothetical protein
LLDRAHFIAELLISVVIIGLLLYSKKFLKLFCFMEG